jgi:hypothetical protein
MNTNPVTILLKMAAKMFFICVILAAIMFALGGIFITLP